MPDSLQSLSARLLRHVLVPLAFTWLAGAAASAGVAYYFVQLAFDRSLLDDAWLVAANMTQREGQLELGLSTREVNRILFDHVEIVNFSVRDADGSMIAGTLPLRLPPPGPGSRFDFHDINAEGRALRVVRLQRDSPQPFEVTVAQTTVGRVAALERLAWISLLPQLVLLAALAAWLRRAIRRDLRPLRELQRALGRRSANDLAPVQVAPTNRDVATLAQAVNALLLRLEGSVRAQREFAGNIAHELRTPLAGIRALAEYGLAQPDPAAWREQLQRISVSQARLSRLVDQLLELALAHEAEAGLRLEPVALDEAVRDAILRFLPRADKAGVDLGAVGIDAPCIVSADATLVEGILNNLLDNALRYGVDAHSSPPAVTVSLEYQDGDTLLAVEDNGLAMPGADQERLVERGAQGRAGTLLGEGGGLGLALVAQYARLMNARMTLASGAGGAGWRCEIRFPAPSGPPLAEGEKMRP